MTLGLLLSLNAAAEPENVAAVLRSHPLLTVGERAGRWLPVAAEAEDDTVCRELHDWISQLPDVAFVDVVHVNFENIAPLAPSPVSAPLSALLAP